MVARIAPVPLAMLLLVVASPAQSPKPAPVPVKAIVVQVLCANEGTPVPRVTGKDLPDGLARARRWEGRKLAWVVGEKKFDTREGLERELHNLAMAPASLRDSVAEPGAKELVPLLIKPGDSARWRDLVETWDACQAAAFSKIQLEGVETWYIVPKSVDEPVTGRGELIVPKAVFNEPDDNPDSLRPTFAVHQDGRIVHDGATLFRWVAGKEDDLEPLRARMRELRATLVEDGELVKRPEDGREVLNMPFLVRADQWAEWRDVRRLITVATDPKIGFWKLELAVGDLDHDAKLRDEAIKDAARRKR